MIYVLFGPPGVGKTYVGNLLSKKIGIQLFDADVIIDKNIKEKIINGSYNQVDRDRFVQDLNKKVDILSKNNDLIVAEAFTKQKNREEFVEKFPDSLMIYVVATKKIAKKRIISRLKMQNHVIQPNNFDHMWTEFDLPEISHEVINNNGLDDGIIVDKFLKIRKG